MDKEVELILSKLKIVSEERERGLYLCDKEHSKLLLDYITNLQQELENKDNEIDVLKDQVKWWEQQCDDLEMQMGENNE